MKGFRGQELERGKEGDKVWESSSRVIDNFPSFLPLFEGRSRMPFCGLDPLSLYLHLSLSSSAVISLFRERNHAVSQSVSQSSGGRWTAFFFFRGGPLTHSISLNSTSLQIGLTFNRSPMRLREGERGRERGRQVLRTGRRWF